MKKEAFMSAEAFKIAKEISSLRQNIQQIELKISDENKRVTHIVLARSQRQEQLMNDQDSLKEMRIMLQKNENEIAKTQINLDKDTLSLKSLTNNQQLLALEKSIEHNRLLIDELENTGLSQLEKIDELELEIRESQDFLKGSEDSLIEISKEVDLLVLEHQSQIDIKNKRIKLLYEQLPEIFREKIKSTIAKKIPQSSFTRIKNGCCEFCRLSLSKVDISNIEDHLKLKSCSGCSRIFIPEQAFY
jgi:predicted  nucleic acid-binding Zn-ribbon protein